MQGDFPAQHTQQAEPGSMWRALIPVEDSDAILQRVLLLLGRPKASDFRVLPCVGLAGRQAGVAGRGCRHPFFFF